MFTPEQAAWVRTHMKRPAASAPAAPPATSPAPTIQSNDDTFPQPMQPDCKVVHNQVPGPANFVLCATHGHILDTDKKQVVAKDLKAFQAQHPEFDKPRQAPGQKKPGHAAPPAHARPKPATPATPAAPSEPAPPDSRESFAGLATKMEQSATALATSLKSVADFEWNPARDGCATELKAVAAAAAAMDEIIARIQKYTATIANGDTGSSIQLQLIVASRTAEQHVETLIEAFEKDDLGACLAKRNDTYGIDTGSADPVVSKAIQQYGAQKTAVLHAAKTLLDAVEEARMWNHKNGKIISW